MSFPATHPNPTGAVPENTRLISAGEPGAIDLVCSVLEQGNTVAVPTETVYGLAANALLPEAVARIYSAKERPSFDPLIVHLPDREWVLRLCEGPVPELALKLMDRFWPGPLTILFSKSELVPDLVTAGLPRVALRMSAHPVFQAVLRQFAGPLAAPSANRFGRISPVTANDVREELEGRIPMILDGGKCERGIESTIVSLEGDRICVLRAGPVTPDELSAFGEVVMQNRPSESPVPGQLPSHYAPRKPVRLVEEGERVDANSALIAFRHSREGHVGPLEILSKTGDLEEAAAHLFSALRRADASTASGIVVEKVPPRGIGIAIMERLDRAAGKEANE